MTSGLVWEDLVNIPITTEIYESIYTMINL